MNRVRKEKNLEIRSQLQSKELHKLVDNYLDLGKDIGLAGASLNLTEAEARAMIESLGARKLIALRILEFVRGERSDEQMIRRLKVLAETGDGELRVRALKELKELEMHRGTLDKEIKVRMVDTFKETGNKEG